MGPVIDLTYIQYMYKHGKGSCSCIYPIQVKTWKSVYLTFHIPNTCAGMAKGPVLDLTCNIPCTCINMEKYCLLDMWYTLTCTNMEKFPFAVKSCVWLQCPIRMQHFKNICFWTVQWLHLFPLLPSPVWDDQKENDCSWNATCFPGWGSGFKGSAVHHHSLHLPPGGILQQKLWLLCWPQNPIFSCETSVLLYQDFWHKWNH